MNYDFKYQSGARAYDPDFGQVIEASDGGFDRGYEQGYGEGETAATAAAEAHNAEILTDCNAVLPTKGVETADTLAQVPQRIGEITVQEDYLRFCWQPKLPGIGMFDKENVVLNFDYAESLDRVFYPEYGYKSYPNTKVKHLTVNAAKAPKDARQAFISPGNDSVLERMTINGDLSKSTNTLGLFGSWLNLRVIDGTPLNLSSSASIGNLFNYCVALEEVRFAPNSVKVSMSCQNCSKLSDAAIQSIIDGLADLTGQAAQTLTIHAAVGAKLIDAQKGAITAKNWTLVY